MRMIINSTAIRPNCRMCGLPINDPSSIIWNGNHYHNDHLPKHEPPQGWQSMDSAPKTCPIILGGGTLEDGVAIGRWHMGEWRINGSIIPYEPSHWMPVPASPNQRI